MLLRRVVINRVVNKRGKRQRLGDITLRPDRKSDENPEAKTSGFFVGLT